MITHTFTVHARCPLNGSWDYYTVTLTTDLFIDVADIEANADEIRGTTDTQEGITTILREAFPLEVGIRVVGRHSQNTETVVEL